MNTKSSKRVVIINNLKSANIEQAIFILRGNEPYEEVNTSLIMEAQQIIDNYIKRIEKPRQEEFYRLEKSKKESKRKGVKSKIFGLAAALFSAAVFIGAVYLAMTIVTV